MKLKNPWPVFIAILVCLAALAMYKSEMAYQHRNLMEGFILLVIATIFVQRAQKRP